MQTTENYGLKKPESTDQYNIEDFNENMDILDEKLQEVFQRGNKVKEGLVSKLVAMDVEADTSETFEELFDKMGNISTGVDTSGDTVNADVLVEGYTAHDSNKNQITGTLPDKTGTANHLATASLDSTNNRLKMKIPALGRFGTGNYLYAAYSTIASLIGLTAAKLVKGNTILGISGNSNNMDTSGADATAAQVLSGKKVCVDGELFTGTMANKAGTTVDAGTVTQDDTYTYLTIPSAGYYDSSSKLRTENSNLTKIYNLGTGTTFNIKSKFPNKYTEFTIENFIICSSSASGSLKIEGVSNNVGAVSQSLPASTGSYNSTTGILTISCGSCSLFAGTNVAAYTSGNMTQSNPRVYLIDGNIETV